MPPMMTIVETAAFSREAESALDEEDLNELKTFIANNPERGVIVPGTGGIRKLRWSASGRGKRGGGRVIYYYHSPRVPLFLFRFFTKASKADLSADEKAKLGRIVEEIKEEVRQK